MINLLSFYKMHSLKLLERQKYIYFVSCQLDDSSLYNNIVHIQLNLWCKKKKINHRTMILKIASNYMSAIWVSDCYSKATNFYLIQTVATKSKWLNIKLWGIQWLKVWYIYGKTMEFSFYLYQRPFSSLLWILSFWQWRNQSCSLLYGIPLEFTPEQNVISKTLHETPEDL